MGASLTSAPGYPGNTRVYFKIEKICDVETVTEAVDYTMTPLEDEAFNKRQSEAIEVLIADGTPFTGYEMHIGNTAGPDARRPLVRFDDRRIAPFPSKA